MMPKKSQTTHTAQPPVMPTKKVYSRAFKLEALRLLKAERSVRVGVKGKRLNYGWDHDYLFRVLLGPSPI